MEAFLGKTILMKAELQNGELVLNLREIELTTCSEVSCCKEEQFGANDCGGHPDHVGTYKLGQEAEPVIIPQLVMNMAKPMLSMLKGGKRG